MFDSATFKMECNDLRKPSIGYLKIFFQLTAPTTPTMGKKDSSDLIEKRTTSIDKVFL
jgi:hypothetical protein